MPLLSIQIIAQDGYPESRICIDLFNIPRYPFTCVVSLTILFHIAKSAFFSSHLSLCLSLAASGRIHWFPSLAAQRTQRSSSVIKLGLHKDIYRKYICYIYQHLSQSQSGDLVRPEHAAILGYIKRFTTFSCNMKLSPSYICLYIHTKRIWRTYIERRRHV